MIAVLQGFTLNEVRRAQKKLKEDTNMPRRGNIAKRDVLPDPVYGDKVVAKLINQVMQDGKKVLHKASCMMRSSQLQKNLGQTQKKCSLKL